MTGTGKNIGQYWQQIVLFTICLAAFLLRWHYFLNTAPNLDAYANLQAALMAPFGAPPMFSGWPGVGHHLLNALTTYIGACMQYLFSGGSASIESFSAHVAAVSQDLPALYQWTGFYFLALSLLEFILIIEILRQLKTSMPVQIIVTALIVLLPMHMQISALNVRPDHILKVALLGSLLFTLRYKEQATTKNLLWFAFFNALAVTNKYSAGMWLISTILFLSIQSDWRQALKQGTKLSLFVGGFVLLLNPYYISHSAYMLKGLVQLGNIVGGQVAVERGFTGNAFVQIFKLYPAALLALFFLYGYRWRTNKTVLCKPRLEKMLIIYTLIFLLTLQRSGYFETHYLLPISIFLPFMLALHMEHWRTNKRIFTACFAALVVLIPVKMFLNAPRVFAVGSSGGEKAAAWFKKNAPAHSTIVYDFGDLWLPQNRQGCEFMVDEVLGRTQTKRYDYHKDELFQATYNQEERVELFVNRMCLRHYVDTQPKFFTYFIMRELKDREDLKRLQPDYIALPYRIENRRALRPTRRYFHKMISDKGTLVQSFTGKNRPLHIYAIKP